MGTILVLGMSSAWAQERDLEVTMDVVPANASARAAGEIKLPITLPKTASPRAQEASASDLETANKARELKGDLGAEFGPGVPEPRRRRDRDRDPPSKSGKH